MSWRRDAPAMGREIKQLLWAVLLFDLFIAFLGYLTRTYFGGWALGVTLGLAAFVTVAFLLILTVNLLGAGLVDVARAGHRALKRRGRSKPGAVAAAGGRAGTARVMGTYFPPHARLSRDVPSGRRAAAPRPPARIEDAP